MLLKPDGREMAAYNLKRRGDAMAKRYYFQGEEVIIVKSQQAGAVTFLENLRANGGREEK